MYPVHLISGLWNVKMCAIVNPSLCSIIIPHPPPASDGDGVGCLQLPHVRVAPAVCTPVTWTPQLPWQHEPSLAATPVSAHLLRRDPGQRDWTGASLLPSSPSPEVSWSPLCHVHLASQPPTPSNFDSQKPKYILCQPCLNYQLLYCNYTSQWYNVRHMGKLMGSHFHIAGALEANKHWSGECDGSKRM